MERITHSTRLVDANGSGRDGYTEGTPGVTPASVVTASALNFVQEEIARAIELLGGTLSAASQQQLGELLITKTLNEQSGFGHIDSEIFYWDPGVAPLAKTRTMLLPLESGRAIQGTGWSSGTVPLVGGGNSDVWHIPLRLPTFSTITQIRYKVDPGAARAAGSNTRLELVRITPGVGDTTTPVYVIVGSVEDDTTADVQTRTLSALSESVDNATKAYAVRLRAGNTAATNNDNFYGVEVTFADPGPRNF